MSKSKSSKFRDLWFGKALPSRVQGYARAIENYGSNNSLAEI